MILYKIILIAINFCSTSFFPLAYNLEFRMTTSIFAPCRFIILMVNILVISEIYPRLAANVDNSLPVLHTQEMVQSETDFANTNLSLQIGFICFELIGLMTGLTLFQYIQSVISIGNVFLSPAL